MFRTDHKKNITVDASNGDILKTTSTHWQATATHQGVFDAQGFEKFRVVFKSYSIDEPEKWPDDQDKVFRKELLSASARDQNGIFRAVLGAHVELDRIVEFYEYQAKTNFSSLMFEFVDLRKHGKQ